MVSAVALRKDPRRIRVHELAEGAAADLDRALKT
jgi:hypothetical protein